jgi:hypothetical protein
VGNGANYFVEPDGKRIAIPIRFPSNSGVGTPIRPGGRGYTPERNMADELTIVRTDLFCQRSVLKQALVVRM